jgi:hypothetical protein
VERGWESLRRLNSAEEDFTVAEEDFTAEVLEAEEEVFTEVASVVAAFTAEDFTVVVVVVAVDFTVVVVVVDFTVVEDFMEVTEGMADFLTDELVGFVTIRHFGMDYTHLRFSRRESTDGRF